MLQLLVFAHWACSEDEDGTVEIRGPDTGLTHDELSAKLVEIVPTLEYGTIDQGGGSEQYDLDLPDVRATEAEARDAAEGLMSDVCKNSGLTR